MMNFDKMTDFLHHLVDEYGIPTVDCSINYKGEEVYRYYYGEGISDKSLYNMYSATKPITATAGLRLMEEGKFKLTDPVYEYIPEFKEMTVKKKIYTGGDGLKYATGNNPTGDELLEEKFEIVKAENPILVKDLFAMSAGFNYNTEIDGIKKRIEENNGRFETTWIIDALKDEPLDFEPGTHWGYSLCHDVLAAFIERVSGKKYDEYVQEKIFDPLGMTDSTYKRTAEVEKRLAKQHRYYNCDNCAREIDNENPYCFGEGYASGGAGIISSVNDYSKFVRAMSMNGVTKDGYRILKPETINLMKTNALNPEALKDFNWEHLKGYGYGLGVRTMMHPELEGIKSVKGEFGWCGAGGAYVMIDTDNQIGVFYAQQVMNNQEPYVHPRLRNITYSIFGF